MIPSLLPDQISVTEFKIAMSTAYQMHPLITMTTANFVVS